MGSGAAKHRGKRQKHKGGPPHQSPSGSSKNASSSSGVPTPNLALQQGWKRFAEQNYSNGHGFTMTQQARDTERHFSAWGGSSQLRNNAITFVSAGQMGMREQVGAAEEEDEEDEEDEEENEEAPGDMKDLQLANKSHSDREEPNVNVIQATVQESHEASQENTITQQVKRLEIAAETDSIPASRNEVVQPSSRPRSTSISSAASEEGDVVVFGGRKAKQVKAASPSFVDLAPNSPPKADALSASATEQATRPLLDERPMFRTANSLISKSMGGPSSSGNATPSTNTAPEISNPRTFRKRHHGRRRARALERELSALQREANPHEQEDEDALIQDYIDNIKCQESADQDEPKVSRNEYHRFVDGAGEENAKGQIVDKNLLGVKDFDFYDSGWTSTGIEDLKDLSTSDDDITEIEHVFARRERKRGTQYLVTAVGNTFSEARWIPHNRLISKTASEEIQKYEEIRQANGLDARDDSDDASDEVDDDDDGGDDDDDDLVDDVESENGENDRIMARTLMMTDEQIAQALAKQEELGMGSSEVLLFNGQEDAPVMHRNRSARFSAKAGIASRTRPKQKQRKQNNFPSAELGADVLDADLYNGFDVMDYDRPSLRPKKNGRKSSKLPPELEDLKDPELAHQMQESWSNDRAKKAIRKQERKEARMLGLLGSKAANGRVDLKTKYQHSGMDADQIRAEFRAFLVQDQEALALAPMEPHLRASVHRLAKALSLKSHSQGKGDNRFPILYRTPYTAHYTIDSIWEIDALMSQRRFFPKDNGPYKPGKQANGHRTPRRGGGGVLAGATYMDGEVVGASAPEIGADNKGRAMLERMGWSSGMGIGKEGNKGGIEVIKHVVKNTKAGLG